MNRSWIVCGSCRGNWPIQSSTSPYLEMQLESQPCPRCEAYTLSCVAVRDLSSIHLNATGFSTSRPEPLAEVWHGSAE